MELAGGILIDPAFSIHHLRDESISLKEGNSAVYLLVPTKSAIVKLPDVAKSFGQFVYVRVDNIGTGLIAYIASTSGVSIARKRYVGDGGASLNARMKIVAAGGYLLLYSNGVYWHECANYGATIA